MAARMVHLLLITKKATRQDVQILAVGDNTNSGVEKSYDTNSGEQRSDNTNSVGKSYNSNSGEIKRILININIYMYIYNPIFFIKKRLPLIGQPF